MRTIKIVGMDPSMSGWGIAHADYDLDANKIVRITQIDTLKTESEATKTTRKNSDDIRRAHILWSGMVNACAGQVMAFAEVPVGSQSSRAMASYGMCCGVLAACPIPLVQVTPAEVKMAAVGIKTASKKDMIAWAAAMHPEAYWKYTTRKGFKTLANANEHAADAVCAIYAGIRTDDFKRAISFLKVA